MGAESRSLKAEQIEAIVVAILAVNNFSLEKAWNLLSALRTENLTDPGGVATADLGELTVRLARAGYDRGYLTEMMAGRLQQLMLAAEAGKLDSIPAALRRDDENAVVTTLRSVKGIGPKVAREAFRLLKP